MNGFWNQKVSNERLLLGFCKIPNECLPMLVINPVFRMETKHCFVYKVSINCGLEKYDLFEKDVMDMVGYWYLFSVENYLLFRLGQIFGYAELYLNFVVF